MIVLLSTGCAYLTKDTFDVNTADFSKAKNKDLCGVYGYRKYRSQEARKELISRKVFTKADWESIDQRVVTSGMSECSVRAAFALDFRKIISTSFRDGSKGKSFIYICIDERVPFCPYTQVDIKNGIVVNVYEREEI